MPDWTAVWPANADRAEPGGQQLTDPNLIKPGWTVVMPGAATPTPPGATVPTRTTPPQPPGTTSGRWYGPVAITSSAASYGRSPVEWMT